MALTLPQGFKVDATRPVLVTVCKFFTSIQPQEEASGSRDVPSCLRLFQTSDGFSGPITAPVGGEKPLCESIGASLIVKLLKGEIFSLIACL